MSSKPPAFTFVDLFAGIGGFHAALSAAGGECVYAVENNVGAAAVYERNWRMPALGDIVEDTADVINVPDHDVLAAGFPCQPFSKSGLQLGMEETRGTLFWNICRVLKKRKPTVLLLENVRNLVGPRHRHEWAVIIRALRDLGYQVSSEPVIFSPHLLPPERGGRPQVRERVFILATYVGANQSFLDPPPSVTHAPVRGWNPDLWSLDKHLPIQEQLEPQDQLSLRLTASEQTWVHAWDDFVVTLRGAGVHKLPSFPLWADAFVPEDALVIAPEAPAWKVEYLRKNARFYELHRQLIDEWLERWDVSSFPASRRKFEWQAQRAGSLRETIMHLRPSGLRVKRPTYVPALVAMSQTTILGESRRRISTREAARLQGLPEWFDFGSQSDSVTYRQLGNGVNVGAAYHVFRQHVLTNAGSVGGRRPELLAAVEGSSDSPDVNLERHWDRSRAVIVRSRSGSVVQEVPMATAV